ncbi:unnamed protein product, partial [Pylaiella littoralis]
MDRRVIFVAEPAPLISHSSAIVGEGCDTGDSSSRSSSSSSSSSSSNWCGGRSSRSSRRKVRVDLEHLRGVINNLSAFCRAQQPEQLQQQGCASGRNGVIPETTGKVTAAAEWRPWSLLPRVRNQQDTALPAAASASTTGKDDGSSDSGSSSSSRVGCDGSMREVLLAAVYPCPTHLLEEPEQELQSRRLTLSSALADALESCGVWLSPGDFEARVLAPTRVLIDLQLEGLDIDGYDDQRPNDSDSSAAAAAGCGNCITNGEPVYSAGGDRGGASSSSPPPPSAQQSSGGVGVCGGGGGISSASKRPRPPSQSRDYGGAVEAARAAGAAAAAEDFVRSAADEITVLTREAAAEMVVVAPGPGGRAGHRSRGMFDVLWVAASCTPEGDHPIARNQTLSPSDISATFVARASAEDELNAERAPSATAAAAAAAAAAISISVPSPAWSSPLAFTLSDTVDRPRSAPLRSALQIVRMCFPQSRLTIWPAGMHADEHEGGDSRGSGSSSGSGSSRNSSIPSEANGSDGNTGAAVSEEIGTQEGGVLVPSTALECSDRDGLHHRRRRPGQQRRQWEAWSESTGARLLQSLVVDSGGVPATEAWAGLDPGLLWRGPVIAGAAAAAAAAAAATAATTTTNVRPLETDTKNIGATAPATSCFNDLDSTTMPASSGGAGSFPTLEGFALRVMAAGGAAETGGPWTSGRVRDSGCGDYRSRNVGESDDHRPKNDDDDDDDDNGGRSVVVIARATATALGRTPALRLARVVSPGEVARVAYLLADLDLAPALELFVEDEERFPGSAAFLKGWAADGRGMLLVAAEAAETATAAGGVVDGCKGGRGGIGGGKGMAMACFPHQRGAKGKDDQGGGGTVTTSWSVTLFRRPWEFSEAAASALVGESGGGGGLSFGFGQGGLGLRSGSELPPPPDPLTAPSSRFQSRPQSEETEEEKEDQEKKTFGAVVASLPVYTSASLLSDARCMFHPLQSPAESADAPSSPMPPPGGSAVAAAAAASGGKRRRSATAAAVAASAMPGRSSSPRGSKRREAASSRMNAAAQEVPTPNFPAKERVQRRSSRIVGEAALTSAPAAAAAAAAAKENIATRDRVQEERVAVTIKRASSRNVRGGCLRGSKSTSGGDGDGDGYGGGSGEDMRGEGEGKAEEGGLLEAGLEQQSDMKLLPAAKIVAAAAATATVPATLAPSAPAPAAAEEESALNDVMDAWAARLPASYSHLGPGRGAITATAAARGGHGEPGGRGGGGKAEAGLLGVDSATVAEGRSRSENMISSSSTLAYALYGSLGEWGTDGVSSGSSTLGVGVESRDCFWAEELLLPGGASCSRIALPNGNASSTAVPATTATAAAAAAPVPSAGRDDGGGDPADTSGRNDTRERSKKRKNDNGGDGGGQGTESTATSSQGSRVNFRSGDNSGGSGWVAAATPAAPPLAPLVKRALSTAEEALEKAGQQQRARVKERRAVAKEQRARMDRPRPRPRPLAAGPGGGRSSGGGGGGASGGSCGNEAFRRRGSAVSGAPHPPPSLGAAGRSGSMGSKLSRGSLILGRSVAESAAAAAGAGGGSTGAGAFTTTAARGGGSGGGTRAGESGGTTAAAGSSGGGSSGGGVAGGQQEAMARRGGATRTLSAGPALGLCPSRQQQQQQQLRPQRQRQKRHRQHGDRDRAASVASLSSSSSSLSSPSSIASLTAARNQLARGGAGTEAEVAAAVPAAAAAAVAAAAAAAGSGSTAARVRRAIFRDPPLPRAATAPTSPTAATTVGAGQADGEAPESTIDTREIGGTAAAAVAAAAAMATNNVGSASKTERRGVDDVLSSGGGGACATGGFNAA